MKKQSKYQSGTKESPEYYEIASASVDDHTPTLAIARENAGMPG
jgi:hypothetical protein